MELNHRTISHKYTQAKAHFRTYTDNFLNDAGSGILSNKKIRKINVISMWIDFIQNYLKKDSANSLYTSTVSYKDLDSILDKIAAECDIVYKTTAESNAERVRSNFSNSGERVSSLEQESTNLIFSNGSPFITEQGDQLEV